MTILGVELRWWVVALITWAVCLLVTIVLVALAPSNMWKLPRDQGDVSTLTASQCKDDAGLVRLGMLLTEGVPGETESRKDQCESPNYSSIVVESQNTWSNFGYLLAGLLILFRAPRILGSAVGINFCLIGLFSWYYHASLRIWAQAFDVSWIYALLLSMIAYAAESAWMRYGARGGQIGSGFAPHIAWFLAALPIVIGISVGFSKANGHWAPESTVTTIVLLVILGVIVAHILFDSWLLSPFDDDDSRRASLYFLNLGHWLRYTPILSPIRNGLVKGIEAMEWLGNRDRILFGTYMVVPALMSFMWKLNDGCGKSLCSPNGFIQPHALWHILGAVSLWWVYDFLAQASASEDDTMIKLGAFGR
jgi:Ceramidase